MKLLQQQQQQQEKYIPDPNDTPPPSIDSKGNARMIADPSDTKPDLWDDEDDGEWEPLRILNPKYEWQPRKIPNPNYIPPPSSFGVLLSLLEKFAGEVNGAAPWLVLGVLIASLLHLFTSNPLDFMTLTNNNNNNSNNNNNNVSHVVKGAMVGLCTPLCSCGALPLAVSMYSSVPLSAIVAFVTASQSSGVDSAFITAGLLGYKAAFCRLGGAFILAVMAGLSIPASLSTASPALSSSSCSKSAMKSSSSSSSILLVLRKVWETAIETSSESFPSVLCGLALSTILLHYAPSLHNLYNNRVVVENDELLSLLLRSTILLLSLPLQLCEHTTATLASALRKSGASAGLSFAFLLSAPATNLPTLLLLLSMARKQQKKEQQNVTKGKEQMVIFRVAVALFVTSLMLSYMIDMMGVDMLVEEDEMVAGGGGGGGGSMDLPLWYRELSQYVGALLFGCVTIRGIKRRFTLNHADKSCCSSVDDSSSKDNGTSCCGASTAETTLSSCITNGSSKQKES
uniref:Uncharacterized protein n=1 Tax=Ditylum brightwellii TaxID=49249 RepID=A0A7S4RJI7_9STRA